MLIAMALGLLLSSQNPTPIRNSAFRTIWRIKLNYIKCISAVLLLTLIAIVPAKASSVDGNIAVYAGSTLIGYVSDTYDASNLFTITPSAAGALNVQIDTAATSPFSILALNPPGSNSYFGAIDYAGDFTSSATSYAPLTGTSLVAAGSTPSSSATNDFDSGLASESTIWSLSGDVLTAQWINPDGTANPTTMFYDQGVDYLSLTGDLSAFQTQFSEEDAEAVTFEFTGNIAPTPEPSSLALFGTGLACALGLVRRRVVQPV